MLVSYVAFSVAYRTARFNMTVWIITPSTLTAPTVLVSDITDIGDCIIFYPFLQVSLAKTGRALLFGGAHGGGIDGRNIYR